MIRTVAGTGTAGFLGDRGRAFNAQLWKPWAVAVDGEGNLYIADSTNDRIRKINTAGFISTVVGSGRSGNAGDGGPATLAELKLPLGVEVGADGDIYIADSANNRVRKVAP